MTDTVRGVVVAAKVTVVSHITQIIPSVGIVVGIGNSNYAPFFVLLFAFVFQDRLSSCSQGCHGAPV